VAAEAAARGYEVFAVGRQEYESARSGKYDLLINANGNSRKYLAQQEPAEEFDLSVRSVMRSLQDFSFRTYVHLSSIDVYPDVSNPARNQESSAIDPASLSSYGTHKYLAEELVRHYAKRWLVLRMGGFVGPGLWKNSIYDLLKKRPLRVHPDSAYQYLHTHDFARMLMDLVALEPSGQTLNVAGDGVISLRKVANMISDRPPRTVADDAPREHYEINLDQLKSLLPETPKTVPTVTRFVRSVLEGAEDIV